MSLKCPNCGSKIPDQLVKSEGARLMVASRRDHNRPDPKLMARIGSLGGKAKRERALERKRAKIRQLIELNQQMIYEQPRTTTL